MAMEFPERLEIYKRVLKVIARREPILYWPTADDFLKLERGGCDWSQVDAEFISLLQTILDIAQECEVDKRMKAEGN